MHYTGNIIRPPHEGRNVLLQVTVGCSHNRCRFCTTYRDVRFRMSPMPEVEADLAEVRSVFPKCPRIFLLNGDAFCLSFEKLKAIAVKIREYLPGCRIISMYASVKNVRNKTVEQLKELRALGINKLTMGLESGDDEVLARFNKGYAAGEIVEQCGKLDAAGVQYGIIYLGALAGRGKGEKNALESANIFNQIHPSHIGVTSLTIMPGSELHSEVLAGTFQEAGELERTRELLVLVKNLNVRTFFAANHISNNAVVVGPLPEEKERMIKILQTYIDSYDEAAMRWRRESLRSL